MLCDYCFTVLPFFQDFHFILKGITRLLNNPLMQTYLPGSVKRIHFHQELLVLFWKMCDINKVSIDTTCIQTSEVIGIVSKKIKHDKCVYAFSKLKQKGMFCY